MGKVGGGRGAEEGGGTGVEGGGGRRVEEEGGRGGTTGGGAVEEIIERGVSESAVGETVDVGEGETGEGEVKGGGVDGGSEGEICIVRVVEGRGREGADEGEGREGVEEGGRISGGGRRRDGSRGDCEMNVEKGATVSEALRWE